MGFSIVFVSLVALLVASAYVSRLYAESGKFLSREFQENIEIFEREIEPHLGFKHNRAALSFALLEQLLTAAICFLLAYSVFAQPTWKAEEAAQVIFLAVMVVLVFDRFVPYLLFSRTRGGWLVRFTFLLRLLIWAVLPLTLILGFLQSIVTLTSPDNAGEEPEHPSEAVDALIEAGQDEGILEESDRELIHSVVEFGDKTVRHVMTPRPSVVAVSVDTTVEQLTQLLATQPYSRVPVYSGDLDHIVGIVSARDLLQVPDADASRRVASSLMKTEVCFVPETKRANELLTEMQRANLRMAIVIDEYGGVAGLVTIEDLIEEIVGELSNEGELRNDAIRESDNSYIVMGTLETDHIYELFGVRLSEDRHATTIGGLITEIAGHIPLPGEVVQDGDVRFEVLESTARRVEKIRVLLNRPNPIPKNGAVE
ncbi:MAG: HlyC/CorC family transporter [Acidobacteria bacterium]|nr:MAG: HlyC/CorC family transporter [Acidobacteriota bacterium]